MACQPPPILAFENVAASSEELVRAYRAALETDDEASLAIVHYRGGRDEFELGLRYALSPDPLDRDTGAQVLAQLGWKQDSFHAESVEVLLHLLSDRDCRVVAAAAIALGHRHDPIAIPYVLPLASHRDADIRFAVVRALSRHDDDSAIAALVKLAADVDGEVRDWAAFGLGSELDRDTREIREALAALLTDGDAEIRGEAMIGLAKRKDERAFRAVVRELKGDFWGNWCLEAAEFLADPRLALLLQELRDKIPDEDRIKFANDFDAALEACCTKSKAD